MLRRSGCVLCAAGPGLHFGLRSAMAIPHPEKAHRGGEDSFFLRPYGLCVADGVGGWASSGVNPAVFTRSLVDGAMAALDAHPYPDAQAGAAHCIDAGIRTARAHQGSCTFVMALMQPDRRTVGVHLIGDCGLAVIRSGKVIFQTVEQQHRFNCPRQLPDDHRAVATALGGLQPGDVLVVGSDGLFDNVPHETIASLVEAHGGNALHAIASSSSSSSSSSAAATLTPAEVEARTMTNQKAVASGRRAVDLLTSEIADMAFRNSSNKTFMSPFALHARNAGYRYQGGKQDDITVVVAAVTEEHIDLPPVFSTIHEVEFSTGKSVLRSGSHSEQQQQQQGTNKRVFASASV